MARPDKAAAVAELAGEFRDSVGAVLTDYRGLTVKQLQELRRVLGDDASYAVVKNTLTMIAAAEAGVQGFDDLLVGPTAIAFIKGDAVVVAKGLRDFAKANSPLVIKGGVLDGKTLTVDEIAKIADLESREVLLGKLAGALLVSLQNAVFLFNAPLAQAARLIGALRDKAQEDPSVLPAGSVEVPATDGTSEAVVATDDTSDVLEPATADETATDASDTAPTGVADAKTATADQPAADMAATFDDAPGAVDTTTQG